MRAAVASALPKGDAEALLIEVFDQFEAQPIGIAFTLLLFTATTPTQQVRSKRSATRQLKDAGV